MSRFEILRTAGFWYLATPYTDPAPGVRQTRADEALEYSGYLMAKGIKVYSPIHATHLASIKHDLPMEFEWWLDFNKAFLDPAAGVIVAAIPGWAKSTGVNQEVQYAFATNKPVFMLADFYAGPVPISRHVWDRGTGIVAAANR